jgi:predicted XRE-type DNA-binding protein
MPSLKKIAVTRSSGNVFRDLGFPREEAEHLIIRADLLLQLQKTIAGRGLKQSDIAKILRVSQPRISDLLRGRLHLFSTDTVIEMLIRLGVRVRFVVDSPGGRRVTARANARRWRRSSRV